MMLIGMANAATISQSDLNSLIAEARQNGAAPVQIHLAAVSLSQIEAGIGAVNSAMAQKTASLASELGATALSSGRWQNGVGQIGLYVTENGLRMLQSSANAISFTRDQQWYQRTNLDGSDGGLLQIANILNTQGYVDVVVTANIEGLQYDTAPDGSVTYSAPGRTQSDVSAKVQSLVSGVPAGAATLGATAAAVLNGSGVFNPQVTLRLNREGVLALAASDAVRHMVPVGFKDVRSVAMDQDALDRARAKGKADVLITVRNPLAGGTQSALSFDGMKRSNKRAMTGLLTGAGVLSPLTADMPVFGVSRVTLTLNELQALAHGNDARLLAVELNKPMATAQLMTSTPTLNMPSVWNAGITGKGQNIIVMDTGVQSNHIFFQNAAGASRVTYEACFGSSAQAIYPAVNATYNVQSACANGLNMVLGVPGAAAPVPNCSFIDQAACAHGTHVAGIAAGRYNPLLNISGLQGIAPDANIIAVQVFSYDTNRYYPPQAFTGDLVQAMTVVANAMTPGTQNNPFVVSLSLAGGSYASSCNATSIAFTAAVQSLVSNGVPVVAATGNAGNSGSISWPACISGVIKVGSTLNDGVGATISSFTNKPDMYNFAGEAVYMVPGGEINGTQTSAVISSAPDFYVPGSVRTGLTAMAGTSQATPHVAGLYALFKSVTPGTTVQNATAWFQLNAGIMMTNPVCAFVGPCQPYYRIRLP